MKWLRGLGIGAKIVFALAVAATVPLLVAGIYSFTVTEEALIAVAERDISARLRNEAGRIEDYLVAVRQDIVFLSGVPPIQGIVRARAGGGFDAEGSSKYEEWTERLSTIFARFGEAKAYYQLFRYIDAEGEEMVRVESVAGVPRPVGPELLQNKAEARYFRETMELAPGTVRISDIDLNVERGRVERPLKPVIRFSVPIFDPVGARQGIVVVNVSGDAVFEALKGPVDVQQYMVSDSGNFFLHPDASKAWGRQLGHGHRLADQFPDHARSVGGPEAGHVRNLEGYLVTYAVVHPDPGDRERYWKLIEAAPRTLVLREVRRFQAVIAALFVAALGVAVGIGFLLSRRWIIVPILDLGRVMKLFGEGHISERAQARSGDEIGQLAVAFNAMAQPLQNAHEALERRVEERTVELTREIAERERVEQDLRTSEARLAGILDIAPEAVISIGLDERIQLFNQGAEAIFGYSAAEILGEPISRLIPERNRQRHPELIAEFASSPERSRLMSRRAEIFGLRKNGEEFPAEASISKLETGAEPIFTVILHDITERKEREEAARENEEKYRSLVELTPDAILVQREGRVVFANSAAVRLFRANAPEQLMGMETVALVHAEDRHVMLERRKSLELGGRLEASAELRRLRLDGTTFIGESVGARIPWYGEQAIVLVIRDNTDREVMREQLRQTQKMEALGQLTGGVAHDFNNLLAVILGNLELVGERVHGDSDSLAMVRRAIEATDRGTNLTRRLLAFSRKQALQPRAVDLNRLVSDMTALLQRTIGETIEIEFVGAGGLWRCLADQSQLENVVLNLAINARDAMPDGGKLTIETANARLDADYAAQNADVTPGQYVMCAVTDTGAGMPPEVVERAFEPFFTTKDVGQGTGLGLSMIFGFVKQSAGHVKIYSEVGHGTTVRIYLPRAGADDLEVEPALEDGTERHGRQEMVLVVEDDDEVRALAVTVLESLGYRIVEAADAEAGLRALEEYPEIVLLFSDVVLPGAMSGPEFAREAQRRRPELKVLFTSGYTENAIVHHGRLEDGVELIEKPYRKAALARRIRAVLEA